MDKQDLFKFWVRLLKFLSILSVIFTILVAILTMVAATKSTQTAQVKTIDQAFIVAAELGHLLIGVCILISAFEPLWFKRIMLILYYWPGRGFFMVYLGVQTVNSSANLKNIFTQALGNFDFVVTMGQVAGWMLIGVGLIFFIMSLMCLRQLETSEEDLSESHAGEEVLIVSENKEKKGEKGDDKKPSAADILLISNMAAALGLSVDAARKKYSTGKVDIDKAAASAPSGKKYVPPPGAMEAVNAAHGGGSGPAPIESTKSAADTDSRRKFQDDDDLEKMYYAGK